MNAGSGSGVTEKDLERAMYASETMRMCCTVFDVASWSGKSGHDKAECQALVDPSFYSAMRWKFSISLQKLTTEPLWLLHLVEMMM